MAVRFFLHIADPAARPTGGGFALQAHGAEEIAAGLRDAFRDPHWFERWAAAQPDPEEVDPELAGHDPDVAVEGHQRDLGIDLVLTTRLRSPAFRHRLDTLLGRGVWTIHDVVQA